LILLVLMVAVLAGFGLDVLCKDGKSIKIALAAMLVIIAGIDMQIVGSPNLKSIMEWVSDLGPPRSDFRQYHRDVGTPQSAVIRHHEGAVNCYMYTGSWPTNVIGWNEPGYLGEQYMQGPGSVRLLSWTPNVMQFEVDTPAPSVLVVNQNYDQWWRVTSAATKVENLNGLIAVRVEAGQRRVVLKYISLSAYIGLAMTFLTSLCAFALAWKESRRPQPSL
jgi:hypothetical protein